MPAIGSLRVELELDDGSFTTRVMRAGTTLRDLDNTIRGNIVSVRALDSGLREVGSAFTKLTLLVALSRDAIYNLYTVFGSWGVSILKTAGELERLNVLLSNMSDKLSEADRRIEGNKATRYIQDLARTAPFALRDLTDGFVKFKAGGLDPLDGSFKALTDGVAAFGGSSETLQRAAIAIQQMAGKGVISMEELRQQLGEAMPNAIALMARAVGMTTGDFVKQVSNGVVQAKPALAAFLAETERVYGGAAVAQMNTYRGSLQMLENTWQRFQATTAGETGSGGFLDATTKAIQELNTALASPQAANFGIALGQVLANGVQSFVSIAKAAYEARGTIILMGEALGTLLAYSLGKRVFAFIAADIAAARIGLELFAGRMAGAAAATSAFAIVSAANLSAATLAVGNFATGLATVIGRIGILATAQGGLALGAIKISNVFSAMTSGVVSSASSIGSFFTRLVAWATGAGAAVSILRIGMIALGGVALGGGILVLTSAVDFLIKKYQQLFRDAGAAYDRIRMGSTDKETVATALKEADALDEQAKAAERQVAAIQRMRTEIAAGKSGTFRLQGLDGQGVNGVADVAPASGGYSNTAALDKAETERAAFAKAARERATAARIEAGRTDERIDKQFADQAVQSEEIAFTRRMQNRRAQYNLESAATAAQRQKAQEDLNGKLIGADASAAQMAEIDAKQSKQRADFYAAQKTDLETRMREVLASLAAATTEQGRAVANALVDAIKAQIDAVNQAQSQVGSEHNGLIGAATDSTGAKMATTALKNMTEAIAEAEAKAQGLGTNLARVNQQIAAGQFGQLTDALKQDLQTAAEKLDNLILNSSGLGRVQVKIASNNAEIKKSVAELVPLFNLLNATVPGTNENIEAQKQLAEALSRVAAQAKAVGTEAQLAFRNLRAIAGVDLSKIEGAEPIFTAPGGITGGSGRYALSATGAPNGRLNPNDPTQLINVGGGATLAPAAAASFMSLAAAAKEAGVELRTISGYRSYESQARLYQARTVGGRPVAQPGGSAHGLGIAVDVGGSTPSDTFMGSAAGYAAGWRPLKGDPGHYTFVGPGGELPTPKEKKKARDPAEAEREREANTVEQLTARYKELQAVQVDGTGEYERQLSILQSNGKETTAYGQNILDLAKKIDEQTANTRRSTEAWTAFRDAQVSLVENKGKIAAYMRELSDPAANQDTRQYINIRGRFTGDRDALNNYYSGLNRPLGSGETTQRDSRLGVINAAESSAMADEAARRAVTNRDAERQIRAGFAETTRERRALGNENLAREIAQMDDLVAHSSLSAEQRKKIEENFSSYVAARREQLTRQTEGATAAMARTWGHFADNMDTWFASSLDKMADNIATFVATGKADWKSLTTSMLTELLKVEIKMAGSQALKLLGSISEGGISGLFSGSGASRAASTVNTAGPGSSFGSASSLGGSFITSGVAHTGGLMTDSLITRLVSNAAFANAPRFHTGIGPHERAAVILKNEGVFTQGQMAAIGNLNHSYGFVETAMAQIAQSVRTPADVAPRSNPGVAATTGQAPAVTINMKNESGQQLTAASGMPRFDGESFVVDVVIKAMSRPGAMRDAMRGVG